METEAEEEVDDITDLGVSLDPFPSPASSSPTSHRRSPMQRRGPPVPRISLSVCANLIAEKHRNPPTEPSSVGARPLHRSSLGPFLGIFISFFFFFLSIN